MDKDIDVLESDIMYSNDKIINENISTWLLVIVDILKNLDYRMSKFEKRRK